MMLLAVAGMMLWAVVAALLCSVVLSKPRVTILNTQDGLSGGYYLGNPDLGMGIVTYDAIDSVGFSFLDAFHNAYIAVSLCSWTGNVCRIGSVRVEENYPSNLNTPVL